jgi:ADP-ribose pyrophosphatase
VVHLGGFYSSPGYGTEFLYLYLAADLKSSQLNAEDTEEIVLVRVPLPRVTELITSGGICDAKSIAGIMMYLEYRKTH